MVQFPSYLRRVLCKTRLIFPRINGPIVSVNNSILPLHCLIVNFEPSSRIFFFFLEKAESGYYREITFIVNLSLCSSFHSVQKLNSGKTLYRITVLNTFIVYFYTKGNTLTAVESKESFDCFSLYVSPKFCRCNLAASLHIKCYVLRNNTYRLIMAPLVKKKYTSWIQIDWKRD